MIDHHPTHDMLVAYAAGATREAVSLIVATHLALCPDCRRAVALTERAAGALLEALPPETMPSTAWEQVKSRLDDADAIASASPLPQATTGTPEPLRTYLGGDLDSVRWIPITRGLAYRPVSAGALSARLLRSRPGCGIGSHTHKGEEFSIVLTGGYTDCSGRYRRGDFQTATSELSHRPVADEGEDCTLFTVASAPLIFHNPFIGLVAKAIGF